MSSQFDLNRSHDDRDGLSVDVQEVYDTLAHAGAVWRETLSPHVAGIDDRLRERITQLSATQTLVAPDQEPVELISTQQRGAFAHQVTQRPSRYPAARRWATALIAAAVVLGFVAILSTNAGHRSSGIAEHGTPTTAVSSTSGPTTGWVDLTRLDYSTTFSANDLPAIAASNPQVVYETMAQGLQQHLPATLRATTNGGRTWTTLPTPVPASHIGQAGIGVSPTNPQTIFLSLIDTTIAECPADRVVSPGEGFQGFCRLEYTSFDGGAHWSVANLPLANGSDAGIITASLSDGFAGPIQSNTLRAQGSHLFAGFECADLSCSRLITSANGGHTWSFTDLPLLAGGANNVCDYTASASDAELYAVTTTTTCDFREQVPLTLWHSTNAGATWAKVRQLATPNERGMALTQDRTTGVTLLYLAAPTTTAHATDKVGESFPLFSQTPSDIKVSTDGGTTWQSAPTQGIPSDHAVFIQMGLLGTLSDGSVVIDVIPPSTSNPSDASNFQGSDLYAWKPGDTRWRLIGSVSQEIDGILVTQSPSGDSDAIYALLTTRDDRNTFTILQKNVTP